MEAKADKDLLRTRIENPTRNLAFFVHLRVTRGQTGEDVLPIRWDDNYFELMPGEMREISATFRAKDLQGRSPTVEVEGWNVAMTSLEPIAGER